MDIIERSPKSVKKFLENKDKPYKISDKPKRILIRRGNKGKELELELRNVLDLQIGVRFVQQILHDGPDLKYVKIDRSHFMNPSRIEKRF